MRVTLRQRREVRNDADSRSAYPAALAQGQPLERSDVLGRTSDIDATLRFDSGKTVAVRLVRVRLMLVDKRGAETGKLDRRCVTNLPRASWTADAISAAYRLRWLIERAFRRMKHAARADYVQTSRETARRRSSNTLENIKQMS